MGKRELVLRLPHLNGTAISKNNNMLCFQPEFIAFSICGEKAMHVVLQNNEKIQVKI